MGAAAGEEDLAVLSMLWVGADGFVDSDFVSGDGCVFLVSEGRGPAGHFGVCSGRFSAGFARGDAVDCAEDDRVVEDGPVENGAKDDEADGADVVVCLEVRARNLSSRACKEELAGAETGETLTDLAELEELANGTAESDFEDAATGRLGVCAGGDCLCSSTSHRGTCLICETSLFRQCVGTASALFRLAVKMLLFLGSERLRSGRSLGASSDQTFSPSALYDTENVGAMPPILRSWAAYRWIRVGRGLGRRATCRSTRNLEPLLARLELIWSTASFSRAASSSTSRWTCSTRSR